MNFRRLLLIISTLLAVAAVVYAPFYLMRREHKRTDGFSVANLSTDLSDTSEWSFSAPFPKNIFNQKFTYLGKGGQSYAFLSEDKTHVIKFFKAKAFNPKWWVDYLPDIYPLADYRTKKKHEKINTRIATFNGYFSGINLLKEETGLIFLNFTKSKEISQKIEITDKVGDTHFISLGLYPFVIQRYAQPNEDLLSQAINTENKILARESIDKIFDLYLKEYAKGVYDKDHGVLHNTGFVEEQSSKQLFPIHFDIGLLVQDETIKQPANYKEDLVVVAKRYEMWIKQKHPAVYEELVSYLEEKLKIITGEHYTLSEFKIPSKHIRVLKNLK